MKKTRMVTAGNQEKSQTLQNFFEKWANYQN